MQEMWIQSLGREDPLEGGMATNSSILGWKNPVGRGAWRATVHGVTKSQTQLKWLSTYAHPIIRSIVSVFLMTYLHHNIPLVKLKMIG